MRSQSKVIFYRYDGSPFCKKIDNILILKNIPHAKVDVPIIPPRPELSEMLGISYRRIPILAIGNDVYCDTSLISAALERRFPYAQGYGALFPLLKTGRGPVPSGIQMAYSTFYCDRTLFRLASCLLPYDEMDKDYLDDRSLMSGTKLDPKDMIARQPAVQSEISSHLDYTEDQLADGREWLFSTETPSLADISLHFVMYYLQPLPASQDVLNEHNFPKTLSWLRRLTTFLAQKAQEGSAQSQKISAKSAAEAIGLAEHEPSVVIGFDKVEASRLGLQAGSAVCVVPDDYGQTHPTRGTLIGFSRQEVVIETAGSTNATVRVHFPRLGFIVQPISELEQAAL